MALKDVTREGIELALQEFDRIGLDEMLIKYGRGPSKRWYIQAEGRYYDQKLICRAAHELQGLGPLPPTPKPFTAGQAKSRLKILGYCVTEKSYR